MLGSLGVNNTSYSTIPLSFSSFKGRHVTYLPSLSSSNFSISLFSRSLYSGISSFNTPNLEEDIVEELLNSDCSE